jgi:hypothetical protein
MFCKNIIAITLNTFTSCLHKIAEKRITAKKSRSNTKAIPKVKILAAIISPPKRAVRILGR